MTELEIKAQIRKLRGLSPTLEILYKIERLQGKLIEIEKSKKTKYETVTNN